MAKINCTKRKITTQSQDEQATKTTGQKIEAPRSKGEEEEERNRSSSRSRPEAGRNVLDKWKKCATQ